ncbi:MAG: hypothetical protein ABIA67_03980 [Candidatus Margulisiibacteriota bacterium]
MVNFVNRPRLNGTCSMIAFQAKRSKAELAKKRQPGINWEAGSVFPEQPRVQQEISRRLRITMKGRRSERGVTKLSVPLGLVGIGLGFIAGSYVEFHGLKGMIAMERGINVKDLSYWSAISQPNLSQNYPFLIVGGIVGVIFGLGGTSVLINFLDPPKNHQQ